MKRGDHFIIFLVAILLIFPTINAEITGKASSQSIDVSLTLLLPAPITNIIFPENKTYITNISFPFNYTSNYDDNEWYNLNGGTNLTLSGDIFLNLTEGGYTINYYANNSVGITYKNVTFTINLTILRILYDEYSGEYEGDSNDFNYTAYEDLLNLSDVVLEHELWGKIEFLEAINIINDSDTGDFIVDLDKYTHVSLNRIEVNSTYLPNFNVPATLTLHNIPFSDPILLKDGDECPTSICTLVSFSDGTIVFNVTNFSVYSTEQNVSVTSTTTTTIVTSGGGGSRTTIIEGAAQRNFELDKGTILVQLKQGETKTERVTVTNIGTEKITINVRSAGDIEDLVVISPLSLELDPQESKEVELLFFSRNGFDLYSGKIFFEDQDGAQDYLSVLLDVESKQALLDLYLDILKDPAIFSAGDGIIADIYVFNIVNQETEIELFYSIVNEDGEIIFEDREEVTITNYLNFTKGIILSEDFPTGNYVLRVTSEYLGKTASSSELFVVTTDLGRFFGRFLAKASDNLMYIGLLVLFLIVFFYVLLKRKKNKEVKRKCCSPRQKNLIKYVLEKNKKKSRK